MDFKESLKQGDTRLVCGNRWLVWNEIYDEWEVFERKPYAKKTVEICCTSDEQEAVRRLLG